ncbi:relaxase/mobilization nuclease domain-containing protein [Pontibacter liquoris]|uniref:relaxase/mobilization nuclease domain-containing protein n=1 Tax=Pontibacter liquoris TaxID=2905677 RepID=UPI001FA7A5B8|nr:relaxase/mobilization nuclease domain-containing protein [Pontibacter liquoris]
MIGKVMIGKSFSGCVRYVMQKPEAVVLAAEGIRTDTVPGMIADFNLQRSLNPELGKAVGHIALSWSIRDREKLTPESMAARAKEYLKKMQISATQYLVVEHRDREHPHLHIIYNRVDYEGKTIPDRYQHRRNAAVCREMTQQHGYYLAPGKGQVNRHRLKGGDMAKYALHDTIKQVLQKVKTWSELEATLQAKGVYVEYKYRRGTDQVQGVSFRIGELSFKGSSVDRSLSYGAISKQLTQNMLLRQQTGHILQLQQRHLTPLQGTTAAFTLGKSNKLQALADTLLPPGAAQTEGSPHLSDYHFKKKRKKRKRKHL